MSRGDEFKGASNPAAHPDAVRSRLGQTRTKLADGSREGGYHDVLHDGARVGSISDYGSGSGEGRYGASPMTPGRVLDSNEVYFDSKSRAARWTTAAHDATKHGINGLTKAHWDYIDKK